MPLAGQKSVAAAIPVMRMPLISVPADPTL